MTRQHAGYQWGAASIMLSIGALLGAALTAVLLSERVLDSQFAHTVIRYVDRAALYSVILAIVALFRDQKRVHKYVPVGLSLLAVAIEYYPR